MGSAALDLAYVACGRFDGTFFRTLHWWDVAAGLCIAKEAGAKITEFGGGKVEEEFDSCVVAAPKIHGQMLELFTKGDKTQKNVVLIEYPRKGSWAVGFATKENSGEIKNKAKRDLINVFIPTTPNPTSGFLIMFPKDEVIFLDMTFEEASKFIVSAGTSDTK